MPKIKEDSHVWFNRGYHKKCWKELIIGKGVVRGRRGRRGQQLGFALARRWSWLGGMHTIPCYFLRVNEEVPALRPAVRGAVTFFTTPVKNSSATCDQPSHHRIYT